MWIITTDGFFSAVHKYCKSDEVLVRGRCVKDLERLRHKLTDPNQIITSTDSDYPARIIVKRKEFSEYLVKEISELDYDNFKNELYRIEDKKERTIRSVAYHDVWRDLLLLEQIDK